MKKTLIALTLLSSFTASAHYVTVSDFNASQAKQDAALNAERDRAWKEEQTQWNLIQTKYTESAGKALEGEVRNNKKDQAARDAGQDSRIGAVESRQDDFSKGLTATQLAAETANGRATSLELRADAGEATDRAIQEAAQTANDRATSLETRADRGEEKDRQQDGVISKNAAAAKAGLNQESTTRAVADNALSDRINAGNDAIKAEWQARATADDAMLDRFTENKAAQARVNTMMADGIATNSARIDNMQRETNRRFADIDKRMDKLGDRADAGAATAMAAAGIPQVMADQTFSMGAAVGGYRSQQAVAVGGSARVSQNVVLKASVGTDTQQGFGYNAGIALGW